ncbi:MAG: hypothetical protein ABIJ34_03440 [archaeon]
MDKKHKKLLSRALKIIAIIVLLFFIFKGLLVLFVLILLSLGLSFIINNLQIRSIGIELVTLIAVLTGMKYGPWTSCVLTFILILYHLATGGFFGPYWFWVIPAYCVAAIISGFMPAADISQLGFYITLGINFNNVLFTGITSPGFLPKYLPYAVTNALFNIILFSLLARPLLLLMI